MEPLVEELYKDAMIVEDLQQVIHESALCNGERIMYYWESARNRLADFVERLASADMEYAKKLLNCWKEAAEGQTDFRVFAANMEQQLLPAVKTGLQKKYSDMEMTAGNWIFVKSDIGFFTAKDKKSNRYIHSLTDPMHEAGVLAERLYRKQIQRFHILGSGLGYLPYQIWETSKHSVEIYVYEEDSTMLEMADRLGVLSWIDPKDLHIVRNKEKEELVRSFLDIQRDELQEVYISDYKTWAYSDTCYAGNIDQLDFNLRTERINERYWNANKVKNLRLQHHSIAELKKDYRFDKKEYAIVSAGPSLNDNIDFLKNSSQQIGIIAINTVLRRLVSEGIRPDIIAMLDPLPALEEHLKGIEEYTKNIPLVMPSTGSCAFVEKYQGPRYYIPENERIDTEGFQWSFGGTVASLALDLAYFLGAEKIYLIGSDLAYSGGVNYADSLVHKKDSGTIGEQKRLMVPANDGGMVQTNPLYNRYREILENQIRIHSEIKVLNLASKGARIQGTQE